MKKKFVVDNKPAPAQPEDDLPKRKPYRPPILTPTGDRRHMPNIREGKISAEVFARNPEKRENADQIVQ